MKKRIFHQGSPCEPSRSKTHLLPDLENAFAAFQKIYRQSKKNKPLRFTINRTQVVALFILLKNMGVLAPDIKDCELAHFLENYVLHSNNKPMTQIKVEISKLKAHEKNNAAIELLFKDLFGKTKIADDRTCLLSNDTINLSIKSS